MFSNPESAFGSTSKLLSQIELIYSAADQPELWPAVMEGITSHVKGESIAMFARFPKESVLALARFQSGSFEEYADYYSSVNPLMARADDMFWDGEVRYSHLAMQDQQFERTEFYADFFRRWNMHYSFGIKIPLGDQPAAYISCQRSKEKGPFTENEGVVYQALFPHLRNSLRLHNHLSLASAKIKGLESALEAFSHAVIGIDSQRRVIFTSRRADDLLRCDDGLRLAEGKLFADRPTENARLQSSLSRAVGLKAAQCSVAINRKSTPDPLHVTITPFRRGRSGGDARLSALIYASEASAPSPSRGSVLRDLFRLTPTEVRIADLIVSGTDVSSTSAQLSLTIETTRFYIKRILAKTGTSRQLDLVRLVNGLPSV